MFMSSAMWDAAEIQTATDMMGARPKSEEVRWCDRCAEKGFQYQLRHYQINLSETVELCTNKSCTYPFGFSENYKASVDKSPSQTLKRKCLYQKVGQPNKRQNRQVTSESSSRKGNPGQPLTAVLQHSEPNYAPAGTKTQAKADLAPVTTEASMCVNTRDTLSKQLQLITVGHDTSGNEISDSMESDSVLNIVGESGMLDCSKDKADLAMWTTSSCDRRGKLFLHWLNKDALCWLDVALCVIVHSTTVRQLITSITSDNNLVRQVVQAFDTAQKLVASCNGKTINLETSVGKVTVKTGGGDSPLSGARYHKALVPVSPVKTSLPTLENLNRAYVVLEAVREEVWQRLNPKMKCARGTNDSPVFALPLLLRESAPLMQTFMVHYEWEMTCTDCGYQHTDSVRRCMPTFPNVPSDFTMESPSFVRDCFMCPAGNQRMMMKFNHLPPVLLVHFVKGLPSTDYTSYNFKSQTGEVYMLTAIIQYKTNPDHFVAWIRKLDGESWMECDDLKRSPSCFQPGQPAFPSSQVHIAMWERQVPSTGVTPQVAAVSTTLPPPCANVATPGSRHPPAKVVTSVTMATTGLRVSTEAVPKPSSASSLQRERSQPDEVLPSVKSGHISEAAASEPTKTKLNTAGCREKSLDFSAAGSQGSVPARNANQSRLQRLRQNLEHIRTMKASQSGVKTNVVAAIAPVPATGAQAPCSSVKSTRRMPTTTEVTQKGSYLDLLRKSSLISGDSSSRPVGNVKKTGREPVKFEPFKFEPFKFTPPTLQKVKPSATSVSTVTAQSSCITVQQNSESRMTARDNLTSELKELEEGGDPPEVISSKRQTSRGTRRASQRIGTGRVRGKGKGKLGVEKAVDAAADTQRGVGRAVPGSKQGKSETITSPVSPTEMPVMPHAVSSTSSSVTCTVQETMPMLILPQANCQTTTASDGSQQATVWDSLAELDLHPEGPSITTSTTTTTTTTTGSGVFDLDLSKEFNLGGDLDLAGFDFDFNDLVV